MGNIFNFGFNLPLHDLVLLAFYIITAIYLLFSAVVYFHWNSYSASGAVSKFTTLAYLIITLPLLIIMGLATFAI
jgi:hypothetical protein